MRRTKVAALGALLGAVAAGGMAPKANAAYIATLEQVGNNVVGTGSGSINTSALTLVFAGGSSDDAIEPSLGFMVLGPDAPENIYSGFTASSVFGPGGLTAYSSETGSAFLINTSQGYIGAPLGYISGAVFTSGATWDNTTLAGLGVTDGSYVWTWGSGATADTFTLNIGPTSVPEPASLALLSVGVLSLGLIRRKRTQ